MPRKDPHTDLKILFLNTLSQVEGCAARMETLLLQKTTKPKTHLPHHSTSPTAPPPPPSSAHSPPPPPPQVSNPNPTASPFKVTSSSTPKKEKDQQHAKISPKGEQQPRRKLIDVTADKENNDSAIGSDLGNVTRSDGSPKSTTSSSSPSSGSSSSKSSPDSGTAAVSRLEGVERALENVRISPLAEQQQK